MAKTNKEKAEIIAALIRKAISSKHENEKKAFHNKASVLMAKWEISERDLEEDKNPYILKFYHTGKEYGNFAYGMSFLIYGIAEMNGGFAFFSNGKARSRKRGTVGVNATERVHLLLEHSMKHFFRQMQYECMMSKITKRQAFSDGFSRRVVSRLEEQLFEIYSLSGALVPTNAAAKDSAFEQMGWNDKSLTTDRGVKTDFNSYLAGSHAGDRADIGINVATNKRLN